ncbi:MAG: class I SAM-dependent methyltransferase [Mycobacterium leprae]
MTKGGLRIIDKVEQFYDANAEYEWNRLARHRMEYELTMRLLHDYIPAPPARVLDIGGGPGRYSIALAGQGYQVTLLDLSASHLAFARQKAAEAGVTLAGTVHGNALDLSAFGDASFDVVLLMGPLYHLLDAAERTRALQEACRVLKPGGILGVAFINRFARLHTREPRELVAHAAEIEAELATGSRHDTDGGFTDAYCAHPAEVEPLLAAYGCTLLAMLVSEGIRFDAESAAQQLSGADWERWVDLNYRVAREESVWGAGIHLMAVARKGQG